MMCRTNNMAPKKKKENVVERNYGRKEPWKKET